MAPDDATARLALSHIRKTFPGVVAMARQAEADIKSGKRHPFQGPVRNQAGKVVIPEGKAADDKMLLSMDWYVEGVQGKLPGK